MTLPKTISLIVLALVVWAVATIGSYHWLVGGVSDVQATTKVITQTVPPGCGWVHNEKPGRHALVCNRGKLRGFQDFEGGAFVPGHPRALNLNLSGGSARHRGYVVLSPDNGKGTILEDGHLHKLLLVRGARYGGTEFRIRPTFRRDLVLCNRAGEGCMGLYKMLRELHPKAVPAKGN